jgi:hypothetical protein
MRLSLVWQRLLASGFGLIVLIPAEPCLKPNAGREERSRVVELRDETGGSLRFRPALRQRYSCLYTTLVGPEPPGSLKALGNLTRRMSLVRLAVYGISDRI